MATILSSKILLRRLRTFFKRPPPTGLPWNLTPSHLAALKALRSQEEYPHYLDFLDIVASFYMEQLLATEDPTETEKLRGFINGLRRAGTLVDEIIQKEEIEDATRRARSERVSDPRAATYGSRAWQRD